MKTRPEGTQDQMDTTCFLREIQGKNGYQGWGGGGPGRGGGAGVLT